MSGNVLAHLGETKLALGPCAGIESVDHWRTGRDSDNIAWLVLDVPDTDTNTISEKTLRSLFGHVAALENEPPRAVVIRSAKAGGFAAGADVNAFADMAGDSAIALLRDGHDVLDRIANLECPTIAIVHGYALGAGFELALACDYRLAISGATFGFPEVLLGLHPGLGGTFRLTGLIDPVEAMTIMLTGKTVHTGKAGKLGIADAVIEERHVNNAIDAGANRKIKKNGRGLKGQVFQVQTARALAARRMRSETEKKASKKHYPAPYALIDLWEKHGGDEKAMQQAEIESFARLLTTDTSQNLQRVYFLRQDLKKAGDGDSNIAHVHVIGAGAMGGDIAAWAAIKGFHVTLSDVETEPLGAAVKNASSICRDEHLSAIETRDAIDRMMPDPNGYGLSHADLVIEAAPERADVKRKIYENAAAQMKKGALLVSNTSSLPLGELAKSAPGKASFAGLHFFNPVPKMQLVEIISHKGTTEKTRHRLAAFCGEIGKLSVRVKDYPGFLVNRALTPYLLEAILLLDEGQDKEVIDCTAMEFGMPMGPVMLADQVGLDICLHVADSLRDGLDKDMPALPDWIREKVEKGETGKKAGKGFYDWSDGTPQPGAESDDGLRDRLILPMLNACVECLRKKIVAEADEIDGAMIFATGFAPFRGGPLHYARQRGIAEIRKALAALEGEHGSRFAADPGWSDLE
jgi:3-hydroxyacyl-CoA dehydrogenase / enoyl-CoA hydratase / 3-hydroxybutyryl-CoA epimerase